MSRQIGKLFPVLSTTNYQPFTLTLFTKEYSDKVERMGRKVHNDYS